MDEENRFDQKNPRVNLVREEENRDQRDDEGRDVTEEHSGSGMEVDFVRGALRAPEFGILQLLPQKLSGSENQDRNQGDGRKGEEKSRREGGKEECGECESGHGGSEGKLIENL